mgnify:CR=1 FL=1|tara:strand:- start:676 stop:1332 length:657 start_codon:yes stop_codon:yes gene_type:complete
MAHRLLPFRQYDENDVVNLYAVDLTTGPDLNTTKPAVDGNNADGVVVRVSNGTIGDDVIDVSNVSDQFMATYSSPVGRNPYPVNPLKVVAAGSGDANAVLGVTLNQTLQIDENRESLLFNPVKKDELQAVLSGQTVPVLAKGVVTFTEEAYGGADSSVDMLPGNSLVLSTNDGKIEGYAGTAKAGEVRIGTILATGNRESLTSTDSWAGAYFVCKIDC